MIPNNDLRFMGIDAQCRELVKCAEIFRANHSIFNGEWNQDLKILLERVATIMDREVYSHELLRAEPLIQELQGARIRDRKELQTSFNLLPKKEDGQYVSFPSGTSPYFWTEVTTRSITIQLEA